MATSGSPTTDTASPTRFTVATPSCKHFTGYRPCSPYRYCTRVGPDCAVFRERWLIVDLREGADFAEERAGREIPGSDQIFRVLVTRPERCRAGSDSRLFDLVLPYDFQTLSMLNIFRFERWVVRGTDPRHERLVDLLQSRRAERLVMRGGEALLRKQTPYVPSTAGTRILLINLGALGDVLMTTALLRILTRGFPGSKLTWVTEQHASALLQNNPLIDTILVYDEATVDELPTQSFDLMVSVDKSRESGSLAELVPCPDKRGFGMNESGHISVFNEEALYAYRLGLDDREKFRNNMKTGQQLLAESVGLEWRRDETVLQLTDEETRFVTDYRRTLGMGQSQFVVGFNTGCSEAYPNKKLGIEQHVYMVKRAGDVIEGLVVLLLGGTSESARNRAIKEQAERAGANCPIIQTPTTEGLRRGILYLDACDALVTGDTAALHIGVALKKYVIAWFGVSCWTEIDLYDRGKKHYSRELACSPCWSHECHNRNERTGAPECAQRIDLDEIVGNLARFWTARTA